VAPPRVRSLWLFLSLCNKVSYIFDIDGAARRAETAAYAVRYRLLV
jgi:hypothetical protein